MSCSEVGTKIKSLTAKLMGITKDAPWRARDLQRIVALAAADRIIFSDCYPMDGLRLSPQFSLIKERNYQLLKAYDQFFAEIEWDYYRQVSVQINRYLDAIDREDMVHVPGLLYEAAMTLSPGEQQSGAGRKKTGSYYTPGYVVRYMVERAMGYLSKNCAVQNPNGDFKALDPACGGGSFLVEIYRWLVRYGVPPIIALQSVYGTDIDSDALEVTRYALSLAFMADCPKAVSPREIKSTLEKQVRRGNALSALVKDCVPVNNSGIQWEICWPKVFPEIFSPQLAENKRGFHLVAGNPPYVSNKLVPPAEKSFFKRHYTSARGQFDLAVPFLEQGLNLLREGGVLCYITSNKFLAADYGRDSRINILDRNRLCELTDVSTLKTFEKTSAYPVIITLRKEKPGLLNVDGIKDPVRIYQVQDWSELAAAQPTVVEQSFFAAECGYLITTRLNKRVLFLIRKLVALNGRIPSGKIRCGLAQTGFNKWIEKGAVGPKKNANLYPFLQAGHVEPFEVCGQDYIDRSFLKTARWDKEKGPKLVIPGIARNLTAAVDYDDRLLGRVYYIRDDETEYDVRYLAVLFNSYVLNFYYKTLYWPVHLEGGYLRFNSTYLASLPLPEIPTGEPADGCMHNAGRRASWEIIEAGSSLINEKSSPNWESMRNLAEAKVFSLYGFNCEEAEAVMDFLGTPGLIRAEIIRLMEGIKLAGKNCEEQ